MSNFIDFAKLSTPYTIKQIQGEVIVTHLGTVDLIVRSATGPRLLTLTEVLYIPTMTLNRLSLQKRIMGRFIPVFGEVPNKCIIMKVLPTGDMEQIALISIADGRLTLECRLARKPFSVRASTLAPVRLSTLMKLACYCSINAWDTVDNLQSRG